MPTIVLSTGKPQKKIQYEVVCPICGARICDVRSSKAAQDRRIVTENSADEVVIKCHSCKQQVGITLK